MRKLIITLVVIGVLVGVGVWWFRQDRGPHLTEQSFTYAPVEFGTIKETVSATGTLRPKDVLVVGSELSGKVLKIFADVNDEVEEGAPLFQLDDEMARLKVQQAKEGVAAAQAAIDQARATRQAAQSALNLQLELAKKGSGFRTETQKYRYQVEAADAGIKAAEAKLGEAKTAVQLAQLGEEKATVRVPNARMQVPKGSSMTARRKTLFPVAAESPARPKQKYIVLERNLVLGQLVAPPVSAKLFTLASHLGEMRVHAQVAEADIAKVYNGLEATFTVSAYSENEVTFTGKVVERRPMPNNVQGAVYYDTVISVLNSKDPKTKEWRLLPGMTAAVDIVLRRHDNVWKAPTAALDFQLDEHYQTEAAKARLAEWQKRSDAADWKPLWVWDAHRNSPWPIFVRVGGKNAQGQPGLRDNQFNEVLEWEPGYQPSSTKKGPRVIISQPPYHKPGLFEMPKNLKL